MSRTRLTRRERREARAARLEQWAASREQKAQDAHERARATLAAIPPGQPVLVGHHSQRRHERALERSDAAMRRAIEHTEKAARMREKAANIRAANDRAIYEDDPDKIERLRARVAELERELDAMKAANARYRKEHPELRQMMPYERDQQLPHPTWAVRNAAANLRRYRQRLAAAEQEAGR